MKSSLGNLLILMSPFGSYNANHPTLLLAQYFSTFRHILLRPFEYLNILKMEFVLICLWWWPMLIQKRNMDHQPCNNYTFSIFLFFFKSICIWFGCNRQCPSYFNFFFLHLSYVRKGVLTFLICSFICLNLEGKTLKSWGVFYVLEHS